MERVRVDTESRDGARAAERGAERDGGPVVADVVAGRDWVVRVWMDDRPGALGALAARIGSVGGNVVGIDILERGAGRVIDELVVAIHDPDRLDLLVSEMQQVDGVDVESIRPVGGVVHDRHADLLDLAADLVACATPSAVLRSLCDGIADAFATTWVAVVDPAVGVLGGNGERPADAWIAAFVDGSRLASDSSVGQGEIVVTALEPTPFLLVADRTGEPFREREHRWIVAIARVAGAALGRR